MNISNNIEAWMLIDGYDNYEVSSFGRLRNNITNKILKPINNGNGYIRITLTKNSLCKKIYIHRLVAEAFCEHVENNNIVDHIDRNRANNHFKNLRWVNLSINGKNSNISKNNTSGNKGVNYDSQSNKWRARWSVDGKSMSKSFVDKEDAINHRKLMEKVHEYL